MVNFGWQFIVFASFSFSFVIAGGEDDSTPDFVLIDDMILSPQQYDVLFTEPSRRNGFTRAVRIWPNASVPYMIDGNYSVTEKQLIQTALKIIEKHTCIKFLPLSEGHNVKTYVYVKPGDGCASLVGHWSGKQIIYLHKKGCLEGIGRILHEFLHVLGFFHMHTTVNRDKYVTIVWENIISTTLQNFVAYETDISMYGTEYDYESITHYPSTAFSKDGNGTIVSKIPGKDHVMGQRDHLSEGDIIRINRMYNCC